MLSDYYFHHPKPSDSWASEELIFRVWSGFARKLQTKYVLISYKSSDLCTEGKELLISLIFVSVSP